MTTKSILINLEKLGKLETIADCAEADYERNSEDADREKVFERAYQNEVNMYVRLSKQIAELIGVDEKSLEKWLKRKEIRL